MLVREGHQDLAWYCYEDAGYKHLPGLSAWRVARLLRHGPWPTPAIVPHEEDEERKHRAIWSYTSQIAPSSGTIPSVVDWRAGRPSKFRAWHRHPRAGALSAQLI